MIHNNYKQINAKKTVIKIWYPIPILVYLFKISGKKNALDLLQNVINLKHKKIINNKQITPHWSERIFRMKTL